MASEKTSTFSAWSAPRLRAIGSARTSQAGAVTRNSEQILTTGNPSTYYAPVGPAS